MPSLHFAHPVKPSPQNGCRDWRNDLLFLAPCLFAALLVRSLFFPSITLADDVNYWMQIITTALENTWPPEKSHWHTRIGFILPCVLLVKIFGLKVWVPYLFPLLGGLIEVALTFFLARQITSEKVAKLAAWFAVFFPLNILYSGYLYLDIWSGLLGAISVWFWFRALQTDRAHEYALASLFFGLAWLCRETIIMASPIYLALWWQAGCWRRPKMLVAIPCGILVLASEMMLYQITAGNWHYRFDSIFESKTQALEDLASDPGFLLTPLVQLFTSHELGLFLAVGLAVAVMRFRQMPRVLVLWLLVGFAWFSWGTMTPDRWIPMQRDPRYLCLLTIPCLTLISIWVMSLQSPFWRRSVVAALITSGLLGASLDAGRVKLSAHRRFVESKYNKAGTTAEPFVYFGIRIGQNFSEDAVKISCANDLGRVSAVKLMPHLPGARLLPTGEARYAVFSAKMQPEKWQAKMANGWRKVAEISGDTVFLREWTIHLMGKLQGRPATSSASSLIVLENPRFKPRPQ